MLYSIEKFTLESKQVEKQKKAAQGGTQYNRTQSRALTLRNFNLQPKDFRRVGLLGAGAYAEVYLVERLQSDGTNSGKFYAMKRMKKRTYNGLTRFVITEKEI